MLNQTILNQLISVNSVFPHERQVAELLEEMLTKRGFSLERQHLTDDRFNLIAGAGEGERTIMYYAHMDTVPAYSGWQREPFALTSDEHNYYGRGVADMKGGIAAFLSAFDAVSDQLNHRVIFVLGVDEENISAGADLFVNNTELEPDLIISLEGDALTETWPHPVILTWGRRGRAAYRVRVPGISAHGATTDQGINAISQAAILISHLDQMAVPDHELLPAGSQYIRSISADANSLSIPDQVEMMIDRHLVPPETSASVLEELREFCADLYRRGELHSPLRDQFEIELMERETPYLEPFVTSLDNPLSQEVIDIVTKRHGSIPPHYGSSVADENVFAKHFDCPVVCVGPAGGNFHGPDEWVGKENLEAVTRTYADFLTRL